MKKNKFFALIILGIFGFVNYAYANPFCIKEPICIREPEKGLYLVKINTNVYSVRPYAIENGLERSETVFKNNELKGIIIGVGINLNANEKDFSKIDKPVTALNIELNKSIDKMIFLESFTNRFFDGYEKFLKDGFISIKHKYENYINFIEKEITINNLNEKITGTAQEITDDGAIVINGRKFFTGDIL